jgi:hypothetical protein
LTSSHPRHRSTPVHVARGADPEGAVAADREWPAHQRGHRPGAQPAGGAGAGGGRCLLLLARRAHIASGTATQCTRRNDSSPPPPAPPPQIITLRRRARQLPASVAWRRGGSRQAGAMAWWWRWPVGRCASRWCAAARWWRGHADSTVCGTHIRSSELSSNNINTKTEPPLT